MIKKLFPKFALLESKNSKNNFQKQNRIRKTILRNKTEIILYVKGISTKFQPGLKYLPVCHQPNHQNNKPQETRASIKHKKTIAKA